MFRSHCHRVARCLGRWIYYALMVHGSSVIPLPLPLVEDLPRPGGHRPVPELPPGHPERCSGAPASRQEHELWAQLEYLGGPQLGD
jgi:uncharacterized protein DUF6059